MSSSPDPQDGRLDPTLPEAWLCELFAPASEDSAGREAPPTEAQRLALASARGHVRALRSLPSLRAPEELEGRVVASLEAGYRQDRAAGLVAGLEAVSAPEELMPLVEARVEENLGEVEAPAVLERLVEERVAAPTEGTIRSMTGRLDRKHAPSELDDRVLTPDSPLSSEFPAGGRLRRFAVVAGAAALVLFAVRLVAAPGEPDVPGSSLKIIRIQSLDAVSASALDRAFLGALTGEYPGGAR